MRSVISTTSWTDRDQPCRDSSDFDGDGELIGCRASNELINITMRLLKEGYTENDIAKIWGGNLLRVMNKAQSAPDNSL